ncbi:hypothetical protein K3495_g15497 [Podosphaera aphanis]|nr:hypothetical protein K3495_g15497 [Podosphaera aphanis]
MCILTTRFIQETFTNDILFDSLTEIDLKVPNINFINETFLTAKEISDLELSLQLREQGVINTPGKPFEEADRAEFNSLIKNGVVKITKYKPIEHDQVRLFNTRLIREVKGKGTANPYEKTRMVVAAWGDSEKKEILTQSPTVQRASQRLVAAISPSLLAMDNKEMGLWTRDISQAYTQSASFLSRKFYAKIPEQFCKSYPNDSILVILKPLYGIPEAGTHWWVTYNNHHRKELLMETSTYDPCLLISKDRDAFGVVAMQTVFYQV